MQELVLVRHAMPALDPAVPPHEWHLGAAGRAAARELAERLDGGLVVSSDEPKARETAEQIVAVRGGDIVLDARLREASRPTAWDQDYRDNARRYLAGETLEEWEPRSEVAARMRAAARGDIVVTHGLAMTLCLGADVRFWDELRFPDAWRYSALAGELHRVH